MHVYGNYKAEHGFTLIELLVAATLMGMVLMTVFSIYSFGLRAFEKGNQKIDLQQNVRIAADMIFREIRYADGLKQVNRSTVRYSNPRDNKRYMITHKRDEIVIQINFVENKIAYHIKELDFSFCEESQVLYFFILGDDGNATFSLQSSVQLKNL